MKELRSFSDRTAIGLSVLCTFHCLALPLFLTLLPSAASLLLNNEAFHFWMVLAVIPSSAYALLFGCKEHGRQYILALGSVGLAFLLLAVGLPDTTLNESGEKAFTLIGATLIAFSHIRNFKLCKQKENCTCSKAKVFE